MTKKQNLIKEFTAKIESFNFANFPFFSRVHKLNLFNSVNSSVYVKRDDELGFGISGSKIRKYLSIIPFLKKNNYEIVLIKGGLQSNNVLSAVQLLIEHQIKPIVCIPENSHDSLLQGNSLLTKLFLSSDNIIYFNNNEDERINTYYKKLLLAGKKTFILNEGGNTLAAIQGCLTLPYDILRNEESLSKHFSHIFIDSGTGTMASSLILGFHFLQKNTIIHVVLIAGDEEYFKQQLNTQLNEFNHLFSTSLSHPTNYVLYKPTNAKSFGATNAKIFKYIAENCKQNGFLLDPIYSAKLFYESNKIITDKNLLGDILLLHSGGGLSLSGFQEKLRKYL